jgi:cytochrome c
MRYPILLALLLVPVATAPAARAAGDPEAGRRVFGRCHVCHSVDPKNDRMVGPNLHGLFGRRAGSLAGFDYSDAMRGAGIVWSEETLPLYIRDPKALVPGNRMVFPGLRSAKEIEDLVAYLKTATQ